jgi:ABC-type Zn2+ transport system substrate-binding protein/surface adhesin
LTPGRRGIGGQQQERDSDDDAGADDDDDQAQPLQDSNLRQRKDDHDHDVQAQVVGRSGELVQVLTTRDRSYKFGQIFRPKMAKILAILIQNTATFVKKIQNISFQENCQCVY